MKDLKHMIYFEKLLDSACNDLVREAQKENRVAVGVHLFSYPGSAAESGSLFFCQTAGSVYGFYRDCNVLSGKQCLRNFPEHCWNGQSRADFSFWMRLPGLISVNA